MIGIDDLRTLTASTGLPRVSIFLPMHKAGNDVRQNPIRMKNALKQVEAQLREHSIAEDGLLDDLRAKLSDTDLQDGFWQHQDHGLAVFVEPGDTRWFPVPIDLKEAVYVGRTYHVKPLLPLMMRDGTFYVLASSQDRTQLFEASRYAMEPIEDDRIPESIDKLLGMTDYEAQTGEHASGPAGPANATGGSPAATTASQGPSPKDYKTTELQQYAVHIGNGVDAVLGGKGHPLVLAADDRLLGMLRDEIQYPHLLDEGLRDQPWSGYTSSELHAKVYELVRPKLETGRAKVMERIDARLNDGGEGASSKLEEVVAAAAFGRVEALMVDPRAQMWGSFEEADGRVRLSSLGDPQAVDLVDLAVVKTLGHGGQVFSYPQAMETPPAKVAAIFRY